MAYDERWRPDLDGRAAYRTPAPAPRRRSLGLTKMAAGGLAAATSAVFGSYLGVLGTVGGAAVGSVATAVIADVYQRVLEGTRDRLRPRAAGPGGYPDGPESRRRSAWPRVLLVSVVLFAVGMAVVTGIERVRGAPLSGGADGRTSVGELLPVRLGGPAGGAVDGLLGGRSGDSDSSSDSSGSSDGKSDHSTGVVGGLLSGL